jgi:hypothetical protein
MNYTVRWIATAHDRLERIWMTADNKPAVMRAAGFIDRILETDPYRDDVVFLGEEKTIVVEPLAVDFEVIEDQRMVLVLNVWMIE